MTDCNKCNFYVEGFKKGNVRKIAECGFTYPREENKLIRKGRLFDNRNQTCQNYKEKTVGVFTVKPQPTTTPPPPPRGKSVAKIIGKPVDPRVTGRKVKK